MFKNEIFEIVAWEYELATSVKHLSVGTDYDGWEHRITKQPPNVPDAAVRKLRPLYAKLD